MLPCLSGQSQKQYPMQLCITKDEKDQSNQHELTGNGKHTESVPPKELARNDGLISTYWLLSRYYKYKLPNFRAYNNR